MISPSDALPVLYSFRRCPYAMRARMALHGAAIELEHREILLKEKPPAMLAASAKGTVPVLQLQDDSVIDESWEIAQWALLRNDPHNWLGQNQRFLAATQPLVTQCDGPFKQALDHYKYADRHPRPADSYRQQGMSFLQSLDDRLSDNGFLLDNRCTIADIAIVPFVRQFAHVDKPWFSSCGLDHLDRWLTDMLDTKLFRQIMQKHPLWQFDST